MFRYYSNHHKTIASISVGKLTNDQLERYTAYIKRMIDKQIWKEKYFHGITPECVEMMGGIHYTCKQCDSMRISENWYRIKLVQLETEFKKRENKNG